VILHFDFFTSIFIGFLLRGEIPRGPLALLVYRLQGFQYHKLRDPRGSFRAGA